MHSARMESQGCLDCFSFHMAKAKKSYAHYNHLPTNSVDLWMELSVWEGEGKKHK